MIGLFLDCEPCHFTWSSPDGREGTRVDNSLLVPFVTRLGSEEGERVVGGPGGDWRFSFSGVLPSIVSTSRAFGAIAPIGNDWTRFRPFAGSQFGGAGQDWVSMTYTGGPGGTASVPLGVTMLARPRGDDPFILGIGTAFGERSDVYVSPLGPRSTAVRTTPGLAGLDIELVPGEDDDWGVLLDTGIPSLDEGEEFTVLMFVAGGEIVAGMTSLSAENDLSVAIDEGSGSRSVPVVDPSNAGFGAQAGPVTIGETAREVETDAGIVGGFMFDCYRCTQSWHSPDGRSGTLEVEWNVLYTQGWGVLGFAGPPGQWRWAWRGVSDSAVIAVYAPFPKWSRFVSAAS